MRKFKRKSFGSSGGRFDNTLHNEELPILDLSKDPIENMRHLLSGITRREHMTSTKKMAFLENFSQFVRSVPSTSDLGFTFQEIMLCLKVALVNSLMQLRAAGYRALRHLLVDENHFKVFLDERVDVFISRSLEMPSAASDPVETVQALRLVRKLIYIAPHLFPMSIAKSLSAICCDTSVKRDLLSNAFLATFCELAVHNVSIAMYSGVAKAIVVNVLDCSIPQMNESIICTLLFLLNHPDYRCYVQKNVAIESVLAPLTDFYYRHNAEIPESAIMEDQEKRVYNSKLALVAIIRSWTGLSYLCDPDNNSIAWLLQVLVLPNRNVTRAIVDALYEIFCLRAPIETDNFVEALQSVDATCMQDSWRLSEDFLVAEAEAVLPHRANATRVNLIDSYLSLLLCVFLEAGILESLVQMIALNNEVLSIRGSILLGELLHMANILLPPSFSGHSHCLQTLMALATDPEKSSDERGKANIAVGYLDHLHKMKKRDDTPKSLFLQALLQPEANTRMKETEENLEMDELVSVIRESHVLTFSCQEFEKWNWNLISYILEPSTKQTKRPEDTVSQRFAKCLVTFYKPSMKYFCKVRHDDKMARQYSFVALQFVDFLLQPSEQPEGEKLLLEWLQEIKDCLVAQTNHSKTLCDVFSTHSLNNTLARDYFLVIGRLTSTSQGIRVLMKVSMLPWLIDACRNKTNSTIIKLIISSVDYGTLPEFRQILLMVMSSGDVPLRLYATKFFRVLVRTKAARNGNWCIEFLAYQLCDQNDEVVQAAFSVLEEACEDAVNLQRLIETDPFLLYLGARGVRLISRYVSVNRGFLSLQSRNMLDVLVEMWKLQYNREYVSWIDLEIAKSFSTFEPISLTGGYALRSNTKCEKKHDVYIIPHLYGELVRETLGAKLISDQDLLSEPVSVILRGCTDTSSDIVQLKAALWAVGHVASTNSGIHLVLNYSSPIEAEQVEPYQTLLAIVDMAANCPVITIRGTCFYVLGLIASSSLGADKLEEIGWDSVRHKGSACWPVHEPEFSYFTEIVEEEDVVIADDNEDIVEEDTVSTTEQTSSSTPNIFGGVYIGEEPPKPCMLIDYSVQSWDELVKKKKTSEIKTVDGGDVTGVIRNYDVNEDGECYLKELGSDFDKIIGFTVTNNKMLYPDQFDMQSELVVPKPPTSTREVFDSGGVFLGSLAIDENSIAANSTSVAAETQEEPLKVTREEKVFSSSKGDILSDCESQVDSIEMTRLRTASLNDRVVDQGHSQKSISSRSIKDSHQLSSSDPGLKSSSNQETSVLHLSPEEIAHSKITREKSHSIEEDRDRSNSVLSDASGRMTTGKRLRGGSTISLGVSPKARGSFSTTLSESPASSTYSRDYNDPAYSAWRTLKRQRSFRREMDTTAKREYDGRHDVRYYDRYTKSLASQYRNIIDGSTKNKHSMPFFYRQISKSVPCNNMSPYVGRTLPVSLSDFFKIDIYEYNGSWAQNYETFSQKKHIRTYDENYVHYQDRCISCRLKDDSAKQASNDSSHSKVKSNVLRLVVKLSSVVSLKINQQELLNLRNRHLWAFKDLCLYCQVMEHLSVFDYRLSIRRFIMGLFDGIDFTIILKAADDILGRNEKNL